MDGYGLGFETAKSVNEIVEKIEKTVKDNLGDSKDNLPLTLLSSKVEVNQTVKLTSLEDVLLFNSIVRFQEKITAPLLIEVNEQIINVGFIYEGIFYYVMILLEGVRE